jgi:hypothetical protein
MAIRRRTGPESAITRLKIVSQCPLSPKAATQNVKFTDVRAAGFGQKRPLGYVVKIQESVEIAKGVRRKVPDPKSLRLLPPIAENRSRLSCKA